jgi:hypothetical protein
MYHDDGSMALSAQRVLHGELPHRDFAELYTGGLAYLDAGIFWLFGEDVLWLRLPLLALFVVYVACFYALTRRFVGPAGAFLATLFAIAWSVPAYPAPMPSWYLLYFSVFGAYAVVRYLEGGARVWLLGAGLIGGLSLTFKIVGIWYVLAVLLAVAVARRKGRDSEERESGPSVGYRAIVTGIALATLVLVVAVLSARIGAPVVANLLIPVVFLCTAVIVVVWRGEVGVGARSSGFLARDAAVFFAGVAVPVGILLVPYVATGSVGAFVDGVLISPQTRFDFAYRSMEGLGRLLWAIPVVAYLICRSLVGETRRRLADVVAGGTLAGIVAGLWFIDGANIAYPLIWKTAQALGPFVIVLGAVAILTSHSASRDRPGRDVTLLIVLIAGLMSLVQFPFSAPVYYCYVAPLILLAGVAAASHAGLARGLFPTLVLGTLVVFGFRFIDHQSFWSLGIVYRPDPNTALVDTRRASVRIIPAEAAAYRRVMRLVREHAAGDVIYAGPDAPEIYFLTDTENPTRAILDFLDTSDSARGRQLVHTLRAQQIRVIVINHHPMQSPRHPRQVIARLRALYPLGAEVDRFEVRWRDVARP